MHWAGIFGLFALSMTVFYAIRGPSHDQNMPVWFAMFFATWVAVWLASEYRKASKEKAR
jgi:hypothetical protein